MEMSEREDEALFEDIIMDAWEVLPPDSFHNNDDSVDGGLQRAETQQPVGEAFVIDEESNRDVIDLSGPGTTTAASSSSSSNHTVAKEEEEEVEEDKLPLSDSKGLLHCCQRGNVIKLRQLLDFPLHPHYVNVNRLFHERGTKHSFYPVSIAAGRGNIPILQYLVEEKQARVDVEDTDGWTPLTRAAYNNRPQAVLYLLSQGANINIRNKDGCNALMWACAKGFLNVVQMLVEHGVDIDAQNPFGRTALMDASEGAGNLLLVEYLLSNGADITLVAHDGNHPYTITSNPAIKATIMKHALEHDIALHEQLNQNVLRTLGKRKATSPANDDDDEDKEEVVGDAEVPPLAKIPAHNLIPSHFFPSSSSSSSSAAASNNMTSSEHDRVVKTVLSTPTAAFVSHSLNISHDHTNPTTAPSSSSSSSNPTALAQTAATQRMSLRPNPKKVTTKDYELPNKPAVSSAPLSSSSNPPLLKETVHQRLYHQTLQDQQAVQDKLKSFRQQLAIQDVQMHRLQHETTIHQSRSTAVISLLKQLLAQELAKTNQLQSKLDLYLGDVAALQQQLATGSACDLFVHKLEQSKNIVEKRKMYLQKKQKQQDEDLRLCVICSCNEKNVAFRPCGHVCMCTDCVDDYVGVRGQSCPICSQDFEGFIPLSTSSSAATTLATISTVDA